MYTAYQRRVLELGKANPSWSFNRIFEEIKRTNPNLIPADDSETDWRTKAAKEESTHSQFSLDFRKLRSTVIRSDLVQASQDSDGSIRIQGGIFTPLE